MTGRLVLPVGGKSQLLSAWVFLWDCLSILMAERLSSIRVNDSKTPKWDLWYLDLPSEIKPSHFYYIMFTSHRVTRDKDHKGLF